MIVGIGCLFMDYLVMQVEYCTPTWQPAGAGKTILQLATMLLMALVWVLEYNYKRLAKLINTFHQNSKNEW